jgi:hypothetical protein
MVVIASDLHCRILIHMVFSAAIFGCHALMTILHFNSQRTHSRLDNPIRSVCDARNSSNSSDSTSIISNSSSDNSSSENSLNIVINSPESLLKVTTIISCIS